MKKIYLRIFSGQRSSEAHEVLWLSPVQNPRIAGETSPPALNIDAWLGWLDFNSHSIDYVYQGVIIPDAVMGKHWMFSLIFYDSSPNLHIHAARSHCQQHACRHCHSVKIFICYP